MSTEEVSLNHHIPKRLPLQNYTYLRYDPGYTSEDSIERGLECLLERGSNIILDSLAQTVSEGFHRRNDIIIDRVFDRVVVVVSAVRDWWQRLSDKNVKIKRMIKMKIISTWQCQVSLSTPPPLSGEQARWWEPPGPEHRQQTQSVAPGQC